MGVGRKWRVVWEESWGERKVGYSKYIVCMYKILKELILDFEKIKEMCLFREQRSYRYRPGSHCKQLHVSQRADDVCQGDNRQTEWKPERMLRLHVVANTNSLETEPTAPLQT